MDVETMVYKAQGMSFPHPELLLGIARFLLHGNFKAFFMSYIYSEAQ